MDRNYTRLKYACYMTNMSMSVIANLPPILFLTFRSLYGLSYTQLGLFVFINFFTQLTVDLIFSFFAHRFNISKTVKITPVLTVIGFVVYAVWPLIFPDAVYPGLILGTVIFSASSGLAEVLISPVIAAIPSQNPEREMSALHSVYAWGVVPVVVLGTLFLLVFGHNLWSVLVLIFATVPAVAIVLFLKVNIPPLKTPEKAAGALKFLKNPVLWLCVLAIFLGGAAECTMSQWSSVYLEQGLGISKIYGDIFGVAMFAVMLGIGRTFYAKKGKNISKALLIGSAGAVLCYITASVTGNAFIGIAAVAITGLCTSMLWPGSLVVAADCFPQSGVAIYAMMAAGGDLGASVVPQLVGIITDILINVPFILGFAQNLNITAEQLAFRAGMLVAAVFPLCGILVFTRIFLNTSKER